MLYYTLLFMALQPPSEPRLSHCWGFEITLRHTTLRGTPLDECSARRRDLYLTTHNTPQQTSMPLTGFEPVIPAPWAAADPRLRPRGQPDWVLYQSAWFVSICKPLFMDVDTAM